MGTLSIIIPVYNGQKFIQRCYESLNNQLYKNLEIIFINDGSTDESLSLLNEIKANDERVVVISQSNQGVVVAREAGIKVASSKYITFLDVDDSFYPNSIDQIIRFLNKDVDIVVTDFNVKENKIDISKSNYLKKILTTAGWELWGKIYKRSLFFNDVELPKEKIRIGEDALVLVQLVLNASTVSVVNHKFYSYYRHDESASNIRSDDYAKEGIKAAKFIEDIFIFRGLYSDYSDEIKAMYLLFYSNSLRRSYIRDLKIKNSMTAVALKKIGLKKSLFVVLSYYGGRSFYNLIVKRLL